MSLTTSEPCSPWMRGLFRLFNSANTPNNSKNAKTLNLVFFTRIHSKKLSTAYTLARFHRSLIIHVSFIEGCPSRPKNLLSGARERKLLPSSQAGDAPRQRVFLFLVRSLNVSTSECRTNPVMGSSGCTRPSTAIGQLQWRWDLPRSENLHFVKCLRKIVSMIAAWHDQHTQYTLTFCAHYKSLI